MDATAVGPMDQIVVYLTAGLGVGQRLKLTTIDGRLRRLPLRQSLMILSGMCFEVDKASLSAGCALDKHPTYKSEFVKGKPVFADRVTCKLP